MKRSIAVVLVMVLASATLSTQAAAREDRDGPGATEANVSLSNFGIADTMAPTVTVIVPENGTTYTQGATVPANYWCADEPGGSGMASCMGNVPSGSPIDTATLGAHRFTVTGTDNAGNVRVVIRDYTVVADTTPPTVTVIVPENGTTYTHGATVAANYWCADDPVGLGLASCVGDVPSGSPIDTASLGAHQFTVTGTDNAGNVRVVTRDYTVVADTTPPTVTVIVPEDGTTYTQGATVHANYWCADDPVGLGLASCVGDVPSGSPIDTATLGGHRFTVTGTDKAGNVRVVTRDYTVVAAPPPPPSDLVVPVPAAVDGSTLTVSWTTPQEHPTDPIVSYTVSGGGQTAVVGASSGELGVAETKTVTLSGVDRSVSHKVTVTAMTSAGLSSSASTIVPGLLGRIFVSNVIESGPAEYDFVFAPPGAGVVTGDWTGDGHSGFASRTGNVFTLVDERGNAQGTASFGKPTDEVFIGDWNASGTDTFGVRRGNLFFLRNSTTTGVADIVLGFGRAGDEVFVGDWNGNGQETFAVRRGNVFFVRNSTTTGVADVVFGFGRAGDEVLVGDWDTDGVDSFAVRRGNKIFIRNDFQTGIAEQTISFGKATDQLLVGDYDADGVDTFAVRRLEPVT